MTVLNSGWPVVVSTDVEVISTTAPLPLSQMAVISPVVSTSPLTGMGPLRVMASSPCTSMAGLNVPTDPKAPAPPTPSTTAMVGRTCWSTSVVFSVVKASSSSGSTAPAPTPRA